MLHSVGPNIEIFDAEKNVSIAKFVMEEEVVFWKWVSNDCLGIISTTAVYHWLLSGVYKVDILIDFYRKL